MEQWPLSRWRSSPKALPVLALALYTALVVYMSLLPFNMRPTTLGGAVQRMAELDLGALRHGGRPDFAANILLAFPIGIGLAALLVPRHAGALIRLVALVFGTQVMLILALTLETAQAFTHDRVASLNDVAAQALGCTLGVAAWIVAGDRLTRVAASLWRPQSRGAGVVSLATLYVCACILVQLVPLDFTTSVSDLARKYRSGGIEVVPFSVLSDDVVRGAWQVARQVALMLPFGIAMALRSAPVHMVEYGGILARATLLVCSIEAAQVALLSRFASVTDAIVGTIAAAIGVALVASRRRSSAIASQSAAPRWVAPAAVAWSLVIAVQQWWPLQFDTEPSAVLGRLGSMTLLPFANVHASPPFAAFFGFADKAVFAMPLGVLAVLASRSGGRGAFLWRLAAAGGVLAIIEAAQLLTPSRSADPTDLLVSCGAVAFGACLAGALPRERTALLSRDVQDARAPRRRPWSGARVIPALLMLLLIGTAEAEAGRITLAWDPSPEPDVAGYIVSYGTSPGQHTTFVDVGNVTSYEILGLTNGVTYYLGVRAYSVDLLQSEVSAEVSGIPTNLPPTITAPADITVRRGAVLLTVTASDPDLDVLTFSAVGLPSGLSINPATGVVSGEVAVDGVGEHVVTVTASDGAASASDDFILTVTANSPPVLTNPGDQTNDTDDVVSLFLTVSDPDGDPLTTSVTGLPGGLTFNATTREISGTPANGTGGAHAVSISVTDGALTVIAVFTWTVVQLNRAPTVNNPGNQLHYVGDGVALQIQASDADGDTLTYSAVNLPPGLGINTATGAISGVPEAVYSASVTVTVSDGNLEASVTFLWEIDRINNAPIFTSPGNQTSAEGDVIALQLIASDPDGDSLTYKAGGLPPGLSIGVATGLVSGTLPYTAAGVYATSFVVSDGEAQRQVFITWTVNNTNRAPSVTDPGSQSTMQGTAVSLAATGSDPDGQTLAWSASGLPPGLAVDQATGAISGTPTTPGTYNVVLTASDGSVATNVSFTWTVQSAKPPVSSPISPSGSILTTTPVFSWAAVPNAAYYHLSIADGASTPALPWYTPAQAGCESGSGTCSAPAPRTFTAGLVAWKVITWNTFGYSPWSTSMTALVDLEDPNLGTARLVSPTGPIATRTPTYVWDPVTDAERYEFSVTDALGVTRESWHSAALVCPDSCSVSPNVTVAIGPGQWKVRAWSTSGAGDWSAPLGFDASSSKPGKAEPVSPAAAVTSTAPTFTWNAVTGTSYYLLRIVDRESVTIDRWYRPADAGCPLGSGSCSASPGIDIATGPALWRVLTWNASGYGPWSDPRNFSVDIADPLAPVPATIGPTGTINNPNATYSWVRVAGAIGYRLSLNNNGGPAWYWWYTPAGAACDTDDECSVTPLAGLANGTANWQVQSWTDAGHSDWSPLISLTVDIAPPAAPVPTSPNGAAGSATPSFTWDASANATYYYVRIHDATGLRVDRWLTPSQVGCLGGSACTFSPGVTLASGPGTWRVLAWNSGGYSPWSASLAFDVP